MRTMRTEYKWYETLGLSWCISMLFYVITGFVGLFVCAVCISLFYTYCTITVMSMRYKITQNRLKRIEERIGIE